MPAEQKLRFVIDVDTTEAKKKIRALTERSWRRVLCEYMALAFGVELIAKDIANDTGHEAWYAVEWRGLLGCFLLYGYSRWRS